MADIQRKTCDRAIVSIRCAVYALVVFDLAMSLGMLGLPSWCEMTPGLLGIAGFVMLSWAFVSGIIGLIQINKDKTHLNGKVLAVMGIAIPSIIFLGFLLILPGNVDSLDRARCAGVEGDWRNIVTAARGYKHDTGIWPADKSAEHGFVVSDGIKGWDGPYLEKWPKRDPWGGVYVFHNDNKFGHADKPMVYVAATKVPIEMARKIDKWIDSKVDLEKGVVRYRDNELYFLIDVSK